MHKITFFILLLFFAKSKAQELIVPYEDPFGLPVVKVSVNGSMHQFVFDTGAYKTVINSQVFSGVPISSKIDDVGGISGMRKSMDQVKFSFNFLDKQFDKEVIYTDLSMLSVFNCTNSTISGIIGRDVMEDYIIEINPDKKELIFYNPSSFNEDKIADFTKIKLRKSNNPRFHVKIGKQGRYVLFDTGSAGKLRISDYKLDQYIKTTKHIAYKKKGSSWGIHGFNNKEDVIHTIYNAEVQIGKLKIENQTVETSRNDLNNMGFGFISQFISYLDLKGEKLYLKQIGKDHIGENTLEHLGFYIRYDPQQKKNFIVSLSTKNNQLQLGDHILSINEEKPPANNCEMYSFLQKFFYVPIKIKLERENKVIEIEQSVQN